MLLKCVVLFPIVNIVLTLELNAGMPLKSVN